MIYAENILICIAVPLLLTHIFIRGQARQFVTTFLLGMVVCLLGAYISGFISLASGFGEAETAIFFSPIVEELMKFLPLLLYLFMFSPREEKLIMAAVGIGAGFALFENCCYILTLGAGSITYILIRGMAVGVMHIVSMLTIAIALITAIHFKALTLPSILGALSLSVTFHGLYNLLVSKPGVTSVIGYALPVVTAILLGFPYRKIQSRGAASMKEMTSAGESPESKTGTGEKE